MERHLNSLGDLANALLLADIAVAINAHHALEKGAQMIEKTAKAEIGHYQPKVGPFEKWAPLAESTLTAKKAAGHTDDDPLLMTGELYASIEHETKLLESIIGTKLDFGTYLEFGTSKMPPRPFMGPALYRNTDAILRVIGSATVAGIMGAKVTTAKYALGVEG